MRTLVVVVLLALGLGGVAGAAPPRASTRASFASLASSGLADARAHWWDARAGWYDDTLSRYPKSMPLARLWSAYPLFETLAGVAVAQPTAAHRAALTRFADSAHALYWNPTLKPVGGYDFYPRIHGRANDVYFDDAGWWGLAFLDAYTATHKAAYLDDARRALVFIERAGWDPNGGGTWWHTRHDHKTIEPLAAATLIATRLYELQHRAADRRWALMMLNWANAHSFNRTRGLYQRNAGDDTVMDYVQGLMATANLELCRTLHRQALCTQARGIADASLVAFPADLDWAPQYDVIYLRWMLEYSRESGDARLYRLAQHNAQRAETNARAANGLWLNHWDGTGAGDGLQTQAATIELFAWLAATPQPS